MTASAHILVVDDDQRLRTLLCKYLSDQGYLVSAAADATEARTLLDHLIVDLMVLDVMMPGETGLELTRALRQSSTAAAGAALPILLLTALGETANRIEGLECGADDYLSKPFEPRELLLRVAAILRRGASAADESSSLTLGALVWDIQREELRRGSEPVHLTTAEKDLLSILARRPGQVVSREDLAELTGNTANPRTVDVQVTRLRKKLDDDARLPRLLQTVRGQGYRLQAG